MKSKALSLVALSLLAAFAFAAGDAGTLTADGSTTHVSIEYPHVHLSGDFGGGTVQCYFADSNGNSTAISGATFTAADDVALDFARARPVWCTLSGATGPSVKWAID